MKNIIPSYVTLTSVRQSDALGLGHAVLCAKHLLNDDPFAVLLPDVLVLDQESHDQNYSFAAMTGAWNETVWARLWLSGLVWMPLIIMVLLI